MAMTATATTADAEPRWLLTAVARTRPAGGLLGAEALLPVSEDLALGAYLNYFYFWAEMGAKLEWRYLGGFLVSALQVGVEPGDYIRTDRPTLDDGRRPGFRAVARGRVELNWRFWRLWIYNRLTVEGRLRTFEERDPFRDAILGAELSFEEAFAPLFLVWRFSQRSAIWAYAEITVAAEVRFGLLDLRPSAGLILEEIWNGLTINLDVYRSLRDDSPVGGWGSLVFVWWRF